MPSPSIMSVPRRAAPILSMALMSTLAASGCHLVLPYEPGHPPGDVGPDDRGRVEGPLVSDGAPVNDRQAPAMDAAFAEAGLSPDGPAPLSWKTVPSPVTKTLRGIWGHNYKFVWAVGDGGTTIRYLNGAWTKVAHNFKSVNFKAVHIHDLKSVFAVGQDTSSHGAAIEWNGSKWIDLQPQSLTPASFAGVWATPAVLFVTDTLGSLHTYSTSGWKDQGFAGEALNDVWMHTKDDGIIAGDGKLKVLSGGKWDDEKLPAKVGELRSVRGFKAGSVVGAYAVGDKGVILRNGGTGGGWVREAAGATTADLYGVWVQGSQQAFAVGKQSPATGDTTILRRSTTGWVPMKVPIKVDLYAVWGGTIDIWAVGAGGVILRYAP